jgi:hypothetical protein
MLTLVFLPNLGMGGGSAVAPTLEVDDIVIGRVWRQDNHAAKVAANDTEGGRVWQQDSVSADLQ